MDSDDDLENFQRMRRAWQDKSGTMPVSSEAARRAKRKETHKSKRAAKRIGKSVSGLHKRRRKGENNG